MNGKYFVDTNILVYAHDAAAGTKHRQARALLTTLWTNRSGVLSTQVLQEFYVNVTRKTASPPSASTVVQWLTDYMQWEVVINDNATILDAIELQSRYQLSFWDAMILQAAHTAGTSTVYSEDLNAGQRYDRVTVVNPFTL